MRVWEKVVALFVLLIFFPLGPSSVFAEMGGDGRIDKTDSCYFVITDRFYNGDPSNDNQGFGEFNPNNPRYYHGGDWQGIKQKLPYIAGMGFTCLYITPVEDNWKGSYLAGDGNMHTSYHGYHAFDFSKPNLSYGTWDDLKDLVAEAHTRKMDVMIDQVYNHMSPTQVLPNYNYPSFSYSDFHHCAQAGNCNAENGELFGLADLDTGKGSVRNTLTTQHTDYYNTVNADGMRFDTVKHIAEEDWGDLTAQIRSKIPGTDREFMLGEVFELDGSDENIAGTTGKYTKAPSNLSSVFNFLLYRGIRDFQDRDAGKLGSIRHWQITQNKFSDPYSLGNFIDNHDVHRFLCDHQNNWNKLKQALYVAFTWPGFPVVYYGTEQGANGCSDPSNREDMWTLGAPPFNEHSELYVHIKRLNAVRNSKNIPDVTFTNGNAGKAIRNGTNFQERRADNCLYAFERKTANSAQVALIMLNSCGTWQEMTDLRTDIGSGWKQETTYGFKWINPDSTGKVSSYWLAPYETLIFEN
jgi:alpha-amylase